MTQTQQKIGFQHVGSFLRPDALKQARAAFANGQITADDLTAVEDTAITTLVAQQVAAGLDVVTDGEFRRSYWHLDNFWGFDGVGGLNLAKAINLPMKKHGMIPRIWWDRWVLTRRRIHSFVNLNFSKPLRIAMGWRPKSPCHHQHSFLRS